MERDTTSSAPSIPVFPCYEFMTSFNVEALTRFTSALTLMVSITCVWLFSTSTALLWLMSSKLTPLAARIWSPILIPFCSARPPGSSLRQTRQQLHKCREAVEKMSRNIQVEVRTWRHRCPGQTPSPHGCWSPDSSRLRWCKGGRSFGGRFPSSSLKVSARSPPPPFACVSSPPWRIFQSVRAWYFCEISIKMISSFSPGSLLLGVADAGHLADPSHHHPQPVVARQHLHSAAHGDALQADTVHLHQFIPYKQAGLLCEQEHIITVTRHHQGDMLRSHTNTLVYLLCCCPPPYWQRCWGRALSRHARWSPACRPHFYPLWSCGGPRCHLHLKCHKDAVVNKPVSSFLLDNLWYSSRSLSLDTHQTILEGCQMTTSDMHSTL